MLQQGRGISCGARQEGIDPKSGSPRDNLTQQNQGVLHNPLPSSEKASVSGFLVASNRKLQRHSSG